MPGTDLPRQALTAYRSSSPCPPDFWQVWEKAKGQVDALELDLQFEPMELGNPEGAYFRLSVTAPDGCILRAKYIRPAGAERFPCVLQFHDYPAASRGWFHLTRYLSVGRGVLAPDCRGQGGKSESGAVGPGPAAYGPMFDGLEGELEELYLYKLFRDALVWARVLTTLEGVDPKRLAVYGEGQGGGLAVAASAMYPVFAKCAAHYPLLCDYRRVWDLDFDHGPYEGLNFFFRWHDPLSQREEEIFGKLGYVDAVNFAPRVTAKVLMSTGLQDAVSPPSAQFALFNALSAQKTHRVYPKHGHELNNFFENEWLKFLLSE